MVMAEGIIIKDGEPFWDGMPGASHRHNLNEMYSVWLLAIEEAVGPQGWSPAFGLVADGDRRVLQIVDWVGGAGEKPSITGYVGASGIVPSIGDAIDIRGAQGVQGDTGPKGDAAWTPVYTAVADGERRVLRIDDWTGGQGTKPATGYLGVSGIVADIGDALDIRGAPGPGAVSSVNEIEPDGSGNVDLGLGSAAFADTGDFATAAQGSKADTAVQPAALSTKLDIESGVNGGKVEWAENGIDLEFSTTLAPDNYAMYGLLAFRMGSSASGVEIGSGTLGFTSANNFYSILGGTLRYAQPYAITHNQDLVHKAYVDGELDNLAQVATSGSYDDLVDKPAIPAAQVNSDWTAASGIAQILNKPSTIGQAEAEAGTATTVRMWTSQRVRQNVAAYVDPILGDIQNALDAINGV